MKNILGFLILATGIVFLLSNIGFIETEATSIFAMFWPVLIVLIGLKIFFEGIIYFIHSLRRDKWHIGKLVWGSIVLVVGVVLLGNNTGWIDFGFRELFHVLWPLLIIYIGVKVLLDRNGDVVINVGGDQARKNNKSENKTAFSNHKKRETQWNERKKYQQFLGDLSLGRQPWELDGADISMGIGSVDIDLTKAVLKEGENIIDVSGWIGSVEILVPRDMAVKAFVDVRIGEVTLFDDTYSGTSRNATYTSPNFYDAEKQVILYVHLNIGDVEVLTID
ncbi:cell wall-active antibiotics response protein LiaF [Bacillus shivajii]|uniref:cell wall-active antibiotics response protein LiaF n=1 Tax=Bacillus shivajii TaxID=1983719 RepID=UPI001CFA3969|nr:cell wall-active antibiotics response protein LiaF [Bacillus shivajii]UCZ51966.1 cell wall-active antibiotics response protein LiaF [Bacillus shivajii]